MTLSKESPRYPFTYACDWLRQAVGLESRADASRLIEKLAERDGISAELYARQIADQYIRHHEKINALEKERESLQGHWRYMNDLVS